MNQESSTSISGESVQKIGGFEDLLNCLEVINYLDENKLKRYLEIFDIQGLY